MTRARSAPRPDASRPSAMSPCTTKSAAYSKYCCAKSKNTSRMPSVLTALCISSSARLAGNGPFRRDRVGTRGAPMFGLRASAGDPPRAARRAPPSSALSWVAEALAHEESACGTPSGEAGASAIGAANVGAGSVGTPSEASSVCGGTDGARAASVGDGTDGARAASVGGGPEGARVASVEAAGGRGERSIVSGSVDAAPFGEGPHGSSCAILRAGSPRSVGRCGSRCGTPPDEPAAGGGSARSCVIVVV